MKVTPSVNKYSNVLAYAEAKQVKPAEVDGWLGNGTLTDKIQAARLHFGRTISDSGQSETQKRLTQEIEKIEKTWKPLLSEIEGMPSSVDLDNLRAVGINIEPGRVEIVAEMDAKGNLIPIGIVQAKDEKLYDLIKLRAVRETKSRLHTFGHVKNLYAFANVVPMGAKKPRSLILKCTAEEWMLYAVNPTMISSAIAVARFKSSHADLPEGVWDLTVDDQKALSGFLSIFKAMKWDIRTNQEGDCEIEIQDGDSKTVDDRIKEINTAKKNAWQAKKDKGEKVSASAPEFTWPDGVIKQTLTFENATKKNVAHVNKGVVFGKDESGVAEQIVLWMSHALRQRIRTAWTNDLKGKLSSKPQMRIRFGTEIVSLGVV